MYRPPIRPPVGAWANHLHSQRIDRRLSQTQAFELVRERLSLSPKSRAVYVALDMGDRQPRPEEAAVLASEFGWPPEGTSAPTGATESGDPLVAALRDQTAAIERLVALLEGDLPARVVAMEQLGSRLAERVFEGEPVQPLHQETTG